MPLEKEKEKKKKKIYIYIYIYTHTQVIKDINDPLRKWALLTKSPFVLWNYLMSWI